MQELHDEPIAAHTTMRVGGPAARMVVVETPDELVDAVREVDDADEPLLVLGGRLEPRRLRRRLRRDGREGRDPRCGRRLRRPVRRRERHRRRRRGLGRVRRAQAVEEGWSGVEALSGIPGSAGATPVQNVGAYGQDVAQTIARVRVWDRREERVRTMTSLDCRFTYRHSVFKAHRPLRRHRRDVPADPGHDVAAGALRRPRRAARGRRWGSGCRWREAREAVLAQRRRRGMVLDDADHDTWSCGSFFTNPILSAVGLRGPGGAGGRAAGGRVAARRRAFARRRRAASRPARPGSSSGPGSPRVSGCPARPRCRPSTRWR